MNAIIYAASDSELERLTGTPVLLTDICSKTILERLTERLIAAGIRKAAVVTDNKEVIQAVQYHENSDKIEMCIYSKELFGKSADSLWLICDACACFEADICSAVKGIPEDKLSGTAFKSSVCSTPIMCVLDESNVNDIDFTVPDIAKERLCSLCGTVMTVTSELPVISSFRNILICQEKLLYKTPDVVKKLTDRNFNGAAIIPPVYIGRNVVISPGAVIVKGSVIADDARVCEGARVSGSYVGKYAVVGKNCSVNKSYLGMGSVLMNRARTAEGCAVGYRSCVNSNTTLAANTVVSASSGKYGPNVFVRGAKPLCFDDDGICSLYDVTADVSAYVDLGKAVGTVLSPGSTVTVGCGSFGYARILSDAVCCGIVSTGANAVDIGECTLPQLSFAVGRSSSQIGIYTGLDRNGDTRLIQKGGLPLLSELEQGICRCYDTKCFRAAAVALAGEHLRSQDNSAEYLRFLSDILPDSLKGLNACVRTSDPTAAKLCDRLFYPANDINGERVVFQLSPDLSSVSAYSTRTGNVHWERLSLLGCKILFCAGKPVSVPYSLPSQADELASAYQGTLLRYCTVNVEDPDTKARGIAALPHNAFIRDGLLLTVMICRYLSDERITLAHALSDIRPLFTTQRYVASHGRLMKALQSLENTVAVGGEGFEVNDGHSKAFIRPSKDKQSLMIFAESVKSEFAAALCDDISQKLRNTELFRHI